MVPAGQLDGLTGSHVPYMWIYPLNSHVLTLNVLTSSHARGVKNCHHILHVSKWSPANTSLMVFHILTLCILIKMAFQNDRYSRNSYFSTYKTSVKLTKFSQIYFRECTNLGIEARVLQSTELAGKCFFEVWFFGLNAEHWTHIYIGLLEMGVDNVQLKKKSPYNNAINHTLSMITSKYMIEIILRPLHKE